MNYGQVLLMPVKPAPAVEAYVRTGPLKDRDGDWTTWTYTNNERRVLEAPADDIIFVEGKSRQEVQEAFMERFPTSQPGLVRTVISGSRVDCPQQLYQQIHVSDQNEWYAGGDIAEAAALATSAKLGYIEVRGLHFSSLTENSQWDAKLRKYVPGPSPLEEFGCYARERKFQTDRGEIRAVEIVYGPDVVARRIKARERKIKRMKVAKPKRTKYITMQTFKEVSAEWGEWLRQANAFTPDPDVQVRKNRQWAIHDFTQALRMMILVFDATAHRQSPAFQRLLAEWRDDELRIVTKRVWCRHGASTFRRLFRWLDREAKVRRPRSRVLRPKILPRYPFS